MSELQDLSALVRSNTPLIVIETPDEGRARHHHHPAHAARNPRPPRQPGTHGGHGRQQDRAGAGTRNPGRALHPAPARRERAKAIAGGFGVPLVRLDFGTLYNKFHGETEKNLRDALSSAEQLEPCVLWIDELEKGLSSSGSSEDGGVSRRVLGYFLTWMAERKSRVFLVATANAVQELPPELLRKGRFDEIFFAELRGTRPLSVLMAEQVEGLREWAKSRTVPAD